MEQVWNVYTALIFIYKEVLNTIIIKFVSLQSEICYNNASVAIAAALSCLDKSSL